MRTIAAAALSVILAACGGGGGDAGTSSTTPPTIVTPIQAPVLSGVLSSSGTISPDPATTAQTLDAVGTVQIVGSLPAGATSVTFPFTVSRTTNGLTTYSGTVTLTPVTAGMRGTVSLTVPAGQPVGLQTYCVKFLPELSYTWTGLNNSDQCTTVQINP